MAIASLVLGIASVLLFVGLFLDTVVAVLALIFGLVAWHSAKRRPGRPGRGLAIAGVVTGLVGLVGSVVFSVYIFHAIAECGHQEMSAADYSTFCED